MEKNRFDIPVVLMFFKRFDYVVLIINRLRELKPRKIYLLSDGGRNDEEISLINKGRVQVESAIDWDCEVVKRYQPVNAGVYNQIALGAKWVFEKEEFAIFLEDDNLPEISFFSFCEKALKFYKNNDKIIWICGTNYLEKSVSSKGYHFTKNMMPCGWASWSYKFLKYYDFNLDFTNIPNFKKVFKSKYKNKKLAEQQYNSIIREKNFFEKNGKYISWDHHMTLSIRMHNLYGIVPSRNQIRNIGVDENSIHGGNSFKSIMTRRFCGIKSFPLENVINFDNQIQIDKKFEKKTNYIILYPLIDRIKGKLAKVYHFIKGDRR